MDIVSVTLPVRHFSGLAASGRSVLRWLLVFVFGAGVVFANPSSPVHAGEDVTPLSPEAERAALLINRLRVDAGLPPLRVHPLLTLAANQHILDMTSSGVYGHTGSDGSTVHDRIARTGYVTDGWNGENWAVSATVDTAIDWWMEDAPHRENVLNRFYSEMGIGVAPRSGGWGVILVVDFSTGSVNGAGGALPQGEETTARRESVDPGQTITSPIPDSGLRYTVAAGDSLFSIGQRYAVDWRSIAQLNGLGRSAVLHIGDRLRIPADGEATTAAPPGGKSEYTVAAGDTLLAIAARFGVAWQTLAAANGLTGQSILQIGDVLAIPPGPTTARGQTEVAARIHTVRAGETIWSIAARYGVDWRELLQQNGLNEQTLLPIGQVLRLPP